MTNLTVHRAQEAELPATVNIQFINKNASYQPGVQQARRLAVKSTLETNLGLAVVMTDVVARNLAERIIYNAWVERTSFGLRLPRQYAHLEPTDVFLLTDASSNLTYRARVTKVTESRNGGLEMECVSDFSPVYHTNVVAEEVIIVPQVPIPVSSTTAMVMALPVINAGDAEAGFYIAMGGTTSGSWRGAALYQSKDNGTTYTQINQITSAATIGKTDNALGNWMGGSTFDELNTLRVRTNLPLVSLPELSVLSGGNMAAVSSYGGGWEIIQFKNAVLQSDGSYLLSGLLRGVKGTEWAMGGHATNDSLVMLGSSGLQHVDVTPDKIGVPMLYKVVSNGQPISSAPAYIIAASPTSLMPFSPTLTGGGKLFDDSFLINWVRRDRLDHEWVDGRDTFMSEATEEYEVHIYSNGYEAVVRTVSVPAAQSFLYSPAAQIADFGSVQNELFFAVYQMSAVVGRGYPAWGHLSQLGDDVVPATPVPAITPKPQTA